MKHGKLRLLDCLRPLATDAQNSELKHLKKENRELEALNRVYAQLSNYRVHLHGLYGNKEIRWESR